MSTNIKTKNSKSKVKETPMERIYVFIAYAFVVILILATLYPLIYVVSSSFSSSQAVMRNQVFLLPVDFTARAYDVVFQFNGLWMSFFNSIFYTLVGTLISLFFTITAAYPLSRKRWKARKFFNVFLVFTMWFGGGMIPFYLVMKELNLLDSRLGILLYGAVSTFYIIIFRINFEAIPDELEESAKIEGANDLQILIQIMIPLSKAVIAAIALYYAVGKWNSYFWEMILLSDQDKEPLQVLLQRIISASQFDESASRALSRGEQSTPQTIKFAAIVVTSIPIVVVYPFLQKYFVAGTLAGSVKG